MLVCLYLQMHCISLGIPTDVLCKYAYTCSYIMLVDYNYSCIMLVWLYLQLHCISLGIPTDVLCKYVYTCSYIMLVWVSLC